MNSKIKVGVCSRSFSKNKVLRAELQSVYPNAVFNDTDGTFKGTALTDFLQGCERAIIALETIDSEVLSRLPGLRAISKYGVGLDSLDFEALRKSNVLLGWTGGVNRRAVAELALTLSLSLIRRVPQATRLTRGGGWAQVIGNQLSEKTVGIIGLGRVGRDLVGLLKPFGCKLLAHDLKPDKSYMSLNQITEVSFETLLKESDVLSIHLPLDASTRNLIGKSELDSMKARAILINTARGGIVDEIALKQHLASAPEFFAGFDVFRVEPPTDLELMALDNFYSTPHIGGSAAEAILAMGRAAIANLDRCVEAREENFL